MDRSISGIDNVPGANDGVIEGRAIVVVVGHSARLDVVGTHSLDDNVIDINFFCGHGHGHTHVGASNGGWLGSTKAVS